MSTFLAGLREDAFKARTTVNYMSALCWHLTYCKYLTHPDLLLPHPEWTKPCHHQLRHIFYPPVKVDQQAIDRQLTESYQYLRQQIGVYSQEATQQTKARNSSEALQLRGRWITFEWMTTIVRAIHEEGWGRMRCLKLLLTQGGATHASLCQVYLLCVCVCVHRCPTCDLGLCQLAS